MCFGLKSMSHNFYTSLAEFVLVMFWCMIEHCLTVYLPEAVSVESDKYLGLVMGKLVGSYK